MSSRLHPVVVGGVGGGGTRVVSQILDALAFEMGPVSTPSLDNVLFTSLFTLPMVARAPATFAELDAFFVDREGWWKIFYESDDRRRPYSRRAPTGRTSRRGNAGAGHLEIHPAAPRRGSSDLLNEGSRTRWHIVAHRAMVTRPADLHRGWKEPNTKASACRRSCASFLT